MLEIAGHCNKNVHFEFFGELFWRAIEVDDDILGLHIGVNIVRNSIILRVTKKLVDTVLDFEFGIVTERHPLLLGGISCSHHLHDIVAEHEKGTCARRFEVPNDLFQLRLTVVYDFIVGFREISFLKNALQRMKI